MKSVFLGLLFVVSSSFAFANGNLPQTPVAAGAATPFESLATWFKAGTPLTFAQFKGFYSGRCFSTIDPQTPQNIMLGYVTAGASAGPGFPQNNYKVWSVQFQHGFPADYFDNVNNFPGSQMTMQGLGADYWNHMSNFVEKPTLTYTYDWEANGNPDEKHELVAYQNYIVEKWSAMIQQDYGYGFGVRNPGETLFMCYYFQKLGQ